MMEQRHSLLRLSGVIMQSWSFCWQRVRTKTSPVCRIMQILFSTNTSIEHLSKLPEYLIAEISLLCYLHRFLQRPLKPLKHANWNCPIVSQLSKNNCFRSNKTSPRTPYLLSLLHPLHPNPLLPLPNESSFILYSPSILIFFLSRSNPCCQT